MSKSEKTILVSALVYTAVYSLLLSLRFNHFAIGGIDLTNYSQALWKIASGLTPIVTAIGSHTLADHFSPIWYPIAFLLVKPALSPEWIMLLHAAAIAGVAPVLYQICRKVIRNDSIALFMALSYLASQYTQRVMMSPIHPESFGGLFIALALLFLVEDKPGGYWLFLILSLASNEDVGLYFAPVGIYLGWVKRRRAAGVLTVAVSLAWVVVLFKLKPLFGLDTQNHWSRLGPLGDSLGEVARNALFRPWLFFAVLLNPDKLFALFQMLLQVGFAPLASGWGAFLAAAPLLFKSLTTHKGMYRFWDHYSMAVLPFLWLGAALGIGRLLGSPALKKISAAPDQLMTRAAGAVLALNILIQAFMLYSPLSFKFNWNEVIPNAHTRDGWRVLAGIPPRASVLTQENVSQALAMRPEIYVIHFPGQVPGGVPKWQPEYVVFDRSVFAGNWLEQDLRATDAFFRNSPAYQTADERDQWVLYRRRNP